MHGMYRVVTNLFCRNWEPEKTFNSLYLALAEYNRRKAQGQGVYIISAVTGEFLKDSYEESYIAERMAR